MGAAGQRWGSQKQSQKEGLRSRWSESLSPPSPFPYPLLLRPSPSPGTHQASEGGSALPAQVTKS